MLLFHAVELSKWKSDGKALNGAAADIACVQPPALPKKKLERSVCDLLLIIVFKAT